MKRGEDTWTRDNVKIGCNRCEFGGLEKVGWAGLG